MESDTEENEEDTESTESDTDGSAEIPKSPQTNGMKNTAAGWLMVFLVAAMGYGVFSMKKKKEDIRSL